MSKYDSKVLNWHFQSSYFLDIFQIQLSHIISSQNIMQTNSFRRKESPHEISQSVERPNHVVWWKLLKVLGLAIPCILMAFFIIKWIRWCLIKLHSQELVNARSMNLKGFSPEWIRWSSIRFQFWENANDHSLHLKGFSPLWIRWCFFRLPFWEEAYEQSLHLKGLSPEWIRWCWIKLLF